MIHGDELRQEKVWGLLPICDKEVLGLPDDELIFNSFGSWSTCFLLNGLESVLLAMGGAVWLLPLSPGLLFFQFAGFAWIFQQVSQVWQGLL